VLFYYEWNMGARFGIGAHELYEQGMRISTIRLASSFFFGGFIVPAQYSIVLFVVSMTSQLSSVILDGSS
jgi:hypothetical protein